jgi:hypothetical protein
MMREHLLKPISIFVLLSAGLSADPAGPSRDYLCEVQDLSVSVPIPELEGTISNHSFISSKLGDSVGFLTFRSHFRLPILALEIVVEYKNEEGETLVQMPYVVVRPKVRSKFQFLVPSEYVGTLKKTVSVGHTIRMASESFVIMPRCPAMARVLAARVMFSNYQTQTWTAKGWTVEPVLKYFPDTLNLPPDSATAPLRLLIRAEITSEGQVASLRSMGRNSDKLTELLEAGLKEWSFYPAQKDGNAVPGELVFLIRFHTVDSRQKKDWGLISLQDVPRPLIVVDLVPDPSVVGKWSLWYGRRPGGTSLE